MTFLDIGDEHYIVCESVISVKSIGKKKCALFLTGQSALEGFVVERNAKELVELICSAGAEDEDENDQDEE